MSAISGRSNPPSLDLTAVAQSLKNGPPTPHSLQTPCIEEKNADTPASSPTDPLVPPSLRTPRERLQAKKVELLNQADGILPKPLSSSDEMQSFFKESPKESNKKARSVSQLVTTETITAAKVSSALERVSSPSDCSRS